MTACGTIDGNVEFGAVTIHIANIKIASALSFAIKVADSNSVRLDEPITYLRSFASGRK
jgi:hypothetical protein